MKRPIETRAAILVIDVGGSHVKCAASDHPRRVSFESGPTMTPQQMVTQVLQLTSGWRYDVISVGYPGVVRRGRIECEPHNLGKGWIGFDFEAAFGRKVETINDSAMQALGAYEGGKMLFLGLGTGLGSAFIADGVIVPMELGHLPCGHRHDYEHHLGERGRKRLGKKKWRRKVENVVEGFRRTLLPDYIVLGGGNVEHVKHLPPQTRRGDNEQAFLGGFRLWEQHQPETNRGSSERGHPSFTITELA